MRWTTELKIGLFIITFFGVFISIMVYLGYWRIQTMRGYRIYVYFTDASRILPGTNVYLDGAPVGKVDGVEWDTKEKFMPRVILRIDRGKGIPVKSTFSILTPTFFGEPTLMASSQDPRNQFIPAEGTAENIGTALPSFETLVAELSVEVKNVSASVNQTLDSLNSVIYRVQAILQDIQPSITYSSQQLSELIQQVRSSVNQVNSRLNRILQNVEGISTDTRGAVKEIREQAQAILKRVENSAASLETISKNFEKIAGSEEFQNTLKTTIENLKVLSENLKKLSDTLGAESFRQSVESSVKNIESVTEKARGVAEEITSVRGSADVRAWFKRSPGTEGQVSTLTFLRVEQPESGWYMKLGGEDWGRANDLLWYFGYGGHRDVSLGVGTRRHRPSLEFSWSNPNLFVEANVWWYRQQDISLQYQILFALEVEKKFSLFAGVERGNKSRPIVGIRKVF